MSNQPTINLITLGCAKNTVDSEHLAGQLADLYTVVFDSDEPADIVIINTCGFILDAKEESIDTILRAAELRRIGQIKQLYVFGCLSERYKDDLRAEIEEVDEFFGARTMDDIIQCIKNNTEVTLDRSQRILSTPPHYAYLKISEGCNWGCGYCAIPLIRGKHRSVPFEELLTEANMLARQGVKELLVIAQDSTYYGMDLYGKRRLAELLEALCKIDGIEWIRLHYAYPAQFPQDVIEVMAREAKICKYLDIPLQHVSDNMLSSMRRGLSKDETVALVKNLRAQIPEIAIRTTMLVGYPGESQTDFDELCSFVKDAKFERLGVFPYSQEEGTYSAQELQDDVPQETKQARADKLMEIQREVSSGNNQRLVGRTLRVLIDRIEDDFYVARTEWDSPEVDGEVLIVSDKKLKIGTFADVEITKAEEYDLYARLI